jgi:hypothetical protein
MWRLSRRRGLLARSAQHWHELRSSRSLRAPVGAQRDPNYARQQSHWRPRVHGEPLEPGVRERALFRYRARRHRHGVVHRLEHRQRAVVGVRAKLPVTEPASEPEPESESASASACSQIEWLLSVDVLDSPWLGFVGPRDDAIPSVDGPCSIHGLGRIPTMLGSTPSWARLRSHGSSIDIGPWMEWTHSAAWVSA